MSTEITLVVAGDVYLTHEVSFAPMPSVGMRGMGAWLVHEQPVSMMIPPTSMVRVYPSTSDTGWTLWTVQLFYIPDDAVGGGGSGGGDA